MVTLEKLTDAALRLHKMEFPILEGIIANANTSSSYQLSDTLLIYVEVEVVNNEINFDSSLRGADHLLHGNACHSLVVHVVGGDHDAGLGPIDLVPEQVPKFIVVLQDFNLVHLFNGLKNISETRSIPLLPCN
jgi:hypothetical protein